MIGLSPLIHVMNWLSYENGTTYMMNAKSAFVGAETRGQVDLFPGDRPRRPPALSPGALAMFHWDATPVLARNPYPRAVAGRTAGHHDASLPSEYKHGTIPDAKLTLVSPSAHHGLLEQNQKIDAEIGKFASLR